ncbi:hypothetical protein PFISCL1PPCAC_17990, partial [Pristionchus fissidentatus]
MYYGIYYVTACLEYTKIFIALNRLTAFVLNDRYEKIWSYLLWMAVTVIFSFPFISYYHLVDVSVYFYKRPNETTYSIDYDHSVRPWRSNRTQSFYLYLGCSLTTLTLNLLVSVYMLLTEDVDMTALTYRLPWLYDLKTLTPGILSLSSSQRPSEMNS